MSSIRNKTLLIFFGEFRTFPLIPHQLCELDKVDIVFSTWGKIQTIGTNFELDKSQIDLCYKILPNIKLLLSDYIYLGHEKVNNSTKMYYHWRTAINSVEDETIYDKVFLHRCDMISEWHTILKLDWKPDTLYVQTGSSPEIHNFWINDYYLGGDFKTVKRFVNLFKDNNDPISHHAIGNKIIEHNFNWENLRLRTFLIRDWHREFISELNNNNIKFINEKRDSDLAYKFVEIHNKANPKFPLQVENFN
jgi:hypothetical protein